MAEVIIDPTVLNSQGDRGINTGAQTDDLIQYQFYLDANGDLVYSKSVDAGFNWGAAVTVRVAGAAIISYSIWPDWWTLGDTGTLIHIAYSETTAPGDLVYRNLDTSTDILSAEVQPVTLVAFEGHNAHADIVKARGGNLYILDNVVSIVIGEIPSAFLRSTDGGATWIRRDWAIHHGVAADLTRSVPGNEADSNDIWTFYWDLAANEIYLQVYDDSIAPDGSWSETLISGGLFDFGGGIATQWSASTRFSDLHAILAVNNGSGVSLDIKVWDVASPASIVALTDVVTANVRGVTVALMIDQNTDDLFVTYDGDPLDFVFTFPPLIFGWNIRYKRSTDGGATWEPKVQINVNPSGNGIVRSPQMGGPLAGNFLPVWGEDFFDLLRCNPDISVPLPPVGPVVPAPLPDEFRIPSLAGRIAYISPDNRVFELITPHDPGRFVISFSGFGTPPIEYITQRGPFQHGESLRDYFLRPSVVQILVRHNFKDRDAWWDGRASILNELRPNRQTDPANIVPGVLRMVKTDDTVVHLNVFIQEGPRFEPRQSSTWDEWSFQEVLRFVAHDPIAFIPTRVDFAFAIALESDLVFPITFPITFGSGEIDLTPDITYTGTWLSLPVIVITGPLEDVRIDNVTTNEKIELLTGVPAGRTVTINLTDGVKTVEDDLGNNLIASLTPDSDLGTFHIAPDPEAPGGVNAMRLRGTNPTGSTSVEIRYFTRFFGL